MGLSNYEQRLNHQLYIQQLQTLAKNFFLLDLGLKHAYHNLAKWRAASLEQKYEYKKPIKLDFEDESNKTHQARIYTNYQTLCDQIKLYQHEADTRKQAFVTFLEENLEANLFEDITQTLNQPEDLKDIEIKALNFEESWRHLNVLFKNFIKTDKALKRKVMVFSHPKQVKNAISLTGLLLGATVGIGLSLNQAWPQKLRGSLASVNILLQRGWLPILVALLFGVLALGLSEIFVNFWDRPSKRKIKLYLPQFKQHYQQFKTELRNLKSGLRWQLAEESIRLEQQRCMEIARLEQQRRAYLRDLSEYLEGLEPHINTLSLSHPSDQGDFLLGSLSYQPYTPIHPPLVATVHLPILLPKYEGWNLLFPSQAPEVVEAIQTLLINMLLHYPPAKLRISLIDPLARGKHAAPLLALQDYDPHLIGERIWAETNHVEAVIDQLSEHMDRVIQKYLRGEYENLESYNARAGALAEAYRVLVFFALPQDLSQNACRKLLTLMQNGLKCGIRVIVLADPQQLPIRYHLERIG
ncbi:MAG: hypothetical protein R2865_14840 [Deinococcales bacterium]